MPRFLLHVNRVSPAWTQFEAHKVNELPASIREELEKLGFERDRFQFGDDDTVWVSKLHHSGHAPRQWSFAVKLLGLGYNFLNHNEREKCYAGETSLLELLVKETTADFNIESHASNLTLKINQLE